MIDSFLYEKITESGVLWKETSGWKSEMTGSKG